MITRKLALAPTSLQNTEPLELIQASAQAGFETIGLRLYRSPGMQYPFFDIANNPSLRFDVKQALTDLNLELLDVLSFYLQPAMQLEAMLPALECGADLGARYALVIGDDPDWSRQVESMGRFCEAADSFGLIASLESPVVIRHVPTLDAAVRLVRESKAPNAKIALDPYQFIRAHHSREELENTDLSLFGYVQFNDGTEESGFCDLGKGQVPLYDILDVLPPDMVLSVEFPQPVDHPAPALDWATHLMNSTRSLLASHQASRQL